MMSLSSVTLIILLVQNLFNPQKQLNKAKTKKDYDEMKQMLQQELAHYWGQTPSNLPKKYSYIIEMMSFSQPFT